MAIRLDSIKINLNGDSFKIPESDERIIRDRFLATINNPKIFDVGRFSTLDKVAGVVGVLALGVIVYLAVSRNFADIPALSYSLVAVSGLAVLKVLLSQHDLYTAKKHLYIAYAIIACRPYLNKRESWGLVRFRCCGRAADITDINIAMKLISSSGMDNTDIKLNPFVHDAWRTRQLLSKEVYPDLDPEKYPNLYPNLGPEDYFFEKYYGDLGSFSNKTEKSDFLQMIKIQKPEEQQNPRV